MTVLCASIQLDDRRREFAPGETVSGRVTLSAGASWKCDYAEVALVWYTEGKGNADRESAAVATIVARGATASPSLSHPFVFRLPMMPWTYHGTSLKIHWVVGVYARPAGADEASAEEPLLVHPRHAKARQSFAGFPAPE